MSKDELREFILKFIKGVRLCFFDFEDVRNAIIIHVNKDKNVGEYRDLTSDEIEIANEILWDLVVERKINPAPYGSGKGNSSKFFIKNK